MSEGLTRLDLTFSGGQTDAWPSFSVADNEFVTEIKTLTLAFVDHEIDRYSDLLDSLRSKVDHSLASAGRRLRQEPWRVDLTFKNYDGRLLVQFSVESVRFPRGHPAVGSRLH